MPWTSPKTFVTGDIIHRSDFHTYFRDQQREMAPAKVTTKGDFLVGLAANSIDRLAVNPNDQLLRAASGETLGAKWSADQIPSGLIMMKVSGACPSGWTEYTATRGKAVVGTPSGGTDAGTVGTALTNLQDKTHTHTGPSHTHLYTNSTVATGAAVARWSSLTSQTGGTGVSSTSAASGSLPYIQLLFCSKD